MDEITTAEPTWLQLESVIPFSEVEKITSLSRDAILKHYSHLCIRLTPARWGMKLKNALSIANGSARQQ